MAELTQKERLQPSLLDRLTDDAPDKTQESREQRVLSLSRLRQGVLRDMGWLLNTGRLAAVENLDDYPLVAGSVINYGIPDLAGTTLSGADVQEIERCVRQAIWDFEPRILRDSVKVTVTASDDRMNHNAMTFDIEGDLWAQPLPLRLYLRTELDLETGNMEIMDRGG
ncbi:MULTISPECIES: type VI secretion system baseplate subunit TssE [unclassified Methylobacter]|jgi:type VI secretion system protein ImpF|uniref:type VI secretion system baseplate subunit TssE n=1 Tax=unclassified Methylobacter TaxID=2635283 RepID=UPI001893AAB9|nr:type VI secretion system baseplate subunit TssE [Methylobacter sp. BlB1]MBF6649846.1 type VI secretion system baseplate subunit TssE [Methylobacter sp. BlB1]